MKKSLSFLRDLEKHNNRDWFQANRARYDEARVEILAFIETLVSQIGLFDPELGPVNPKSTLFRINRDIRFSRDKSPYKTNFGAFIAREGKKSGYAGYYFHLDPTGSFMAGGIYHPEPEVLKKVRQEVYENPEEFLGIVTEKTFREYFGELYDDRLKTCPKGYPKDFEYIDLLRYKSYLVSRDFKENLLSSGGLLEETLKGMRLVHPLVRFINYALE
jgi:uncharacterized protein (TIGR02453 family)